MKQKFHMKKKPDAQISHLNDHISLYQTNNNGCVDLNNLKNYLFNIQQNILEKKFDSFMQDFDNFINLFENLKVVPEFVIFWGEFIYKFCENIFFDFRNQIPMEIRYIIARKMPILLLTKNSLSLISPQFQSIFDKFAYLIEHSKDIGYDILVPSFLGIFLNLIDSPISDNNQIAFSLLPFPRLQLFFSDINDANDPKFHVIVHIANLITLNTDFICQIPNDDFETFLSSASNLKNIIVSPAFPYLLFIVCNIFENRQPTELIIQETLAFLSTISPIQKNVAAQLFLFVRLLPYYVYNGKLEEIKNGILNFLSIAFQLLSTKDNQLIGFSVFYISELMNMNPLADLLIEQNVVSQVIPFVENFIISSKILFTQGLSNLIICSSPSDFSLEIFEKLYNIFIEMLSIEDCRTSCAKAILFLLSNTTISKSNQSKLFSILQEIDDFSDPNLDQLFQYMQRTVS